jgi:hypothetical protein
MAASLLQREARKGALRILAAAAKMKKPFTPYQRLQWTKAFNALQRLAGKKLVARGKGLKRDRRLARAA